jgi:hypothetical protein
MSGHQAEAMHRDVVARHGCSQHQQKRLAVFVVAKHRATIVAALADVKTDVCDKGSRTVRHDNETEQDSISSAFSGFPRKSVLSHNERFRISHYCPLVHRRNRPQRV